MPQLDNKTFVIVGGTTGLGLSAARAFVAAGAKVVVVGRTSMDHGGDGFARGAVENVEADGRALMYGGIGIGVSRRDPSAARSRRVETRSRARGGRGGGGGGGIGC